MTTTWCGIVLKLKSVNRTLLPALAGLLLAGRSLSALLPGDHRIGAAAEPGGRLLSNSIIDIVPARGSVWLGTGRGLAQIHFDGSGWTTIGQQDGIGPGGVSALAVTDTIIWAATAYSEKVRDTYYPAGGGIGCSRDGGNSWTWMPQPVDPVGVKDYSPTTTNIQNVTFDLALTDSAIWIASWGGGLRWLRYDRLQYTEPDSLKWNLFTVDGIAFAPRQNLAHRVFAAAWDGQSLWVGSAAGVHRIADNGQTRQSWSHEPGVRASLSGNFVTALAVQKLPATTLIWAATWYADRATEYYGVSVTDDYGANWRVALSDSTRLLSGEYLVDVHGSLRAHNFGFHQDPLAPGFDDSTIYVAADEVLWQSTDLGLTWGVRASADVPIFDPTIGERFENADYFSAATTGDSLWVGTDDGLAVGWFDSQVGAFTWRIHRAYEPASELGQPRTYAYPNPFSPRRGGIVRFQIRVSAPTTVFFGIWNFAMEPVFESMEVTKPGAGTEDMAGYGSVSWNGKTAAGKLVANGVYFYRVKVGSREIWGKVMVLD